MSLPSVNYLALLDNLWRVGHLKTVGEFLLLWDMPCITPHVCRHTFCSNIAKSGMNPKTLQYIMGHSDIGVTLNTYNHLQFEDALEEMKKVVG